MTTTCVAEGADVRLHVETSGRRDSPALFLLQGQASSSDWWTDLRLRYSERFFTVTMDYRGTGLTRAPDGDLSTGLLARDAVIVLDALGLDQVHLYGTSMGGRVAQMIAVQSPDRVLSTILAATSPGGPHAVERTSGVRRDLAHPNEAHRLAALVGLFYTPGWGNDARKSRLLGDPTMTAAARQRHLRMSARHDAWDLLPQISSPVLIVHGSEDAMTPLVNASLLADRLSHACLHVHEGGRHGFFDEFADVIDPVLDTFWISAGA